MKIKKYAFLLLALIIFSTNSFSDPMENLILQLDKWMKALVKERTDFREHKFSRSKQNEKRLQKYKSEIPSIKVLFGQKHLLKNYNTASLPEIPKSESDIEDYLKPEQYYALLKQYQKEGKSFQNGDLLFYQEVHGRAVKESNGPDLPSSPCGIISIKNDRFYLMKVDNFSDFQIIPLEELFTAQDPKLTHLGFYRFNEKFDKKEMTYLLEILSANKDQIMFDPYYVRNPKIKNPEKYFITYSFLYPTELIYLIYDYLNKHKTFLSSDQISSKEIFRRYDETDSIENAYFDRMDKQDYLNNQFIIFPAHIMNSTSFIKIFEISIPKKDK